MRAGGGDQSWASSCLQELGEVEAEAPGIHQAVWRRLSWLQVCPASLIKRNAEDWPGEKQVTMACPTRAGRAEKGAGHSIWAFYRENLEAATPTNPAPPMLREQGFPYQTVRRRAQKGPQGSSGPELAGRARPRMLWRSAPPGKRFPSPASGHSSSSSPVDPCWYSPHFPATAAACCTSHAHLLEVCSLPTLTAGPPGLPKLPRGSGHFCHPEDNEEP